LKDDDECLDATSQGQIDTSMGLSSDDGDVVSCLKDRFCSDLNDERVAKRELNNWRRACRNWLDDRVYAAVDVIVHIAANERLESRRRWLHTDHGSRSLGALRRPMSCFYNVDE